MTDSAKLQSLFEKSGYKLSFIAKTIGISEGSLRNKRDNVTDFKPSEIKALCNLLGVTSLKERESIFFV